jgi:hypothetical protein
MSEAVFEQSFSFSFTPTKGDTAESLAADSIVSARIYASPPTDAQRDDENNTSPGDALQSKTSWSSGTDTNEQVISFDAISDPDPDSAKKREIYYAVISYKLTSGGNTINDIEPFIIWRPEGVVSRFNVTTVEIFALESKLENLFTTSEINSKIDLSERLVKQDLLGKGFDIQRLRMTDGKDLVRFMATSLLCLDASNDPDDEWMMKSEKYEKRYQNGLITIPLGYDTDDDGDIEPGEEDVRPNYSVGFFPR